MEHKDKQLEVIDVPAIEVGTQSNMEEPQPQVEEPQEEKSQPQGAEEPKITEVRREPMSLWAYVLIIFGTLLLSAVVGGVVLGVVGGGQVFTSAQTLMLYLIQMLPPMAVALWLRKREGKDLGIHLGIKRINPMMLLWGMVLILVSGVLLEPLLMRFPTEAYEGVTDAIGLGGWAILSTVVCAPLFEEILFRGAIFETTRERYGAGAAVFISALLFGAIHMIPVQVINAFVVGLIFGFIYLKTRSLATVILLHAFNNALGYISMAFFDSSAEATLSAMVPAEWLYWTIYAISAVVALWSGYKLWQELHADTELE